MHRKSYHVDRQGIEALRLVQLRSQKIYRHFIQIGSSPVVVTIVIKSTDRECKKIIQRYDEKAMQVVP